MKTFVLILIMLYTLPTLAFDNVKDSITTYPYRYDVKIGLLNLLDFMNKNVSIEVEKKVTNKITLQVGFSTFMLSDVAFQINNPERNPWLNIRNRRFKLSVEPRFYNSCKQKRHFTVLNYFGLNSTYIHKYYFDARYFYVNEPTYIASFLDTVWVKKNTISLNATRGHIWVHKQFIVECNYGLGLKYYDIKFDDKSYSNQEPSGWQIIPIAEGEELEYLAVNIMFNIKVGYVFK